MGGGSAVRQYQRRFLQGESEETGRKEDCEEGLWKARALTFGEYGVRETKSGEYELVKKDTTVGVFSKACIEKERVLFLLSRGTLLEVSERGVREIASPEKATLMGMIASDGGTTFRRGLRSDGRYRTEYLIRFHSRDKELVEIFDKLSEVVYHKESLHYTRKRNGLITSVVYSKGIFYDLGDFNVKPAPYEFHVPREHLDDEGKRAFLRGFFSGDGNISISSEGKVTIRFYSTCRSGIEELHQTLKDLGFHPNKIREEKELRGKTTYNFTIPREEHIKFIKDIGSYRPRHMHILEEIKREAEGREEE
ncbi:MAG: LAGLIDADG family homing endonuclease [Thermoproteota archaeon]|nr:hypothetical protein [Candidatus Brockarchaeota archaeon]